MPKSTARAAFPFGEGEPKGLTEEAAYFSLLHSNSNDVPSLWD